MFSPFFRGFRLPGAKTERTGEKWRKTGEIWGRNGRETVVTEWRWAQAGSPLEQFQFWVCLSSNLFLTGLQMLWGRLVIRNSLRVLGVLEKPKKEGRRD